MNAYEVIAQAQAVGLTLQADGDRLMVRGPRAATLPLLDTLRAYKPAILAVLVHEAAEVAWRMAVFRRQVPPHGTIPFLVARVTARKDDAPRTCGHCGDSLAEGRRFCCAACQRAKELVLGEVREGMLPMGTATAYATQPSGAGGER